MSADKALKFWSSSTAYTDHAKVWPRMTIVAYSQRDAAQLYVEVGGGQRGAIQHIREFCGTGGGSAFHAAVPNPSRGVYFYDDRGGKVKGKGTTAIMYIEPKSRSIIDDVPEEAKELAAGQQIPDDYGRLRVGFDHGVKVDEWTFSSPYADRAVADRMKATVRLERATRSKTVGKDGMEFVARSDCFGKGKELRHRDIQKLFEIVQEEFRTYDLAQRGVVWEAWLQIEVMEEHVSRDEHGAGFTVKYEPIKRGIDPRNGRVMTINNNNVVTDFPKARAAGEKKKRGEDDDDWHFGDDHQVAYLPATPANIAALDAIIVAINSARMKLEGILNQRDIAKTLASIPTVPLLEARP